MFHHHQHVPTQYYSQPYPLHVHTDLPPTAPPLPSSSSPPSAGPPSSVVDYEYQPHYQYHVAEQYSEATYQHPEQHGADDSHWQSDYSYQEQYGSQPHYEQSQYDAQCEDRPYQQQQEMGDGLGDSVHQQYQPFQEHYQAPSHADHSTHEYAEHYHNPYDQYYEVQQSPVEVQQERPVEPHMDALHPPTPQSVVQPGQVDHQRSMQTPYEPQQAKYSPIAPPSPPPLRSHVPLDRYPHPYSSPPAAPSPRGASSSPPRAGSPIPRLSQPHRSRSHSNSGYTSSDAPSPLPIVPSQSHVPFRPFHPYPRPAPQAIFGLFGSYPLSRGPREHPLPGPTCAPETSSSVMRLVLTPPVKRLPPPPPIMASTSAAPPPPVTRRPRMACFFCRKRKIACGPGPAAVRTAHGGKDCSSFEDDGPCNQCARRGLECTRPTESRRGVRKGRNKDVEEDGVGESSPVASGSGMTLELAPQAPRPVPVTCGRERVDADTRDPPSLPPPLPPPLRPPSRS